MANECSYSIEGGQFCVTCTGQPFVETIPPHIVTVPVLSWNAGADLVAGPFSDNLELVFNVGPSGGIVCGLTQTPRPRLFQEDPADFRYGWYTTAVLGHMFAQPVEAGALIDIDNIEIDSDTVLTIRRVGRVVSYYVNDGTETLVYVSGVRSTGDLYAGAAIFASTDQVA